MLSTINMKHKIKLHCKQLWQNRGIYRCHMIDTVHLILGDCPFLSWCGNWSRVVYIFSFVWFLSIFSLLSILAHWLKVLFEETSLFSTARWMPSHSNYFIVHVEEPRLLPNSTWNHMKMCLKYLNHFSQ